MSINENQAGWCLNLISDLYKWKLSSFFRTPLDPEDAGFGESFTRIKRNIDLDTVKANLLSGKYSTVDVFLADLRLIADNAILLFGPDTVMTFMAEEFKAFIDERAVFAKMTPEQAWMAKLKELQEKIAEHVAKRPLVGASADGVSKLRNKKKKKR